MDILDGLNKQQQEAVLATEGPVLVLAGAGSGKTKALTHRIAYLILNKNISLYNILAVTFTNKAAEEMSDRVSQLLISSRNNNQDTITNQNLNFKFQNSNETPLRAGAMRGTAIEQLSNNTKLPYLGTFHSICVKILRREAKKIGYGRGFTIYDDSDTKSLIKRVMKEQNIDPKEYNPQSIANFISGAKNELIDAKEYKKYVNSAFLEIVSSVYTKYQDHLKEYNAMDFDDLIMNCVRLFERDEETLKYYQNLFKYILIDEYQDTNQAQYRWVKLLAKKYLNIMVVGDDYQAIYGWRGANFKNILNFEKDYKKAKVIKLEQNYRSTETILSAANEVIKFNRNRTEKNLWTDHFGGAPITVYEARNEKDEAEFICLEIKSLNRSQISPARRCYASGVAGGNLKSQNYGGGFEKFAVFYRTNAQSRSVEEALIRENIPYRIFGGIKFYLRKEIKDVIAYLRLIANPADFEALERASGAPARGIGEATLRKIQETRYNNQTSSNNQIPISKQVREFFRMIEEFRGLVKYTKLDRLIEIVVERSGLKKSILDGTPEGEGRWENVLELLGVAQVIQENHKSQIPNSKQISNSKISNDQNNEDQSALEEFLERVALIQGLDDYDKNASVVTLMTLHMAKGLEFETVFIAGVEEGIFPHSRSQESEAELEEERRLCYVGITRAKARLYLIYAEERNIFGRLQFNSRSRFIDHIPENLLDLI